MDQLTFAASLVADLVVDSFLALTELQTVVYMANQDRLRIEQHIATYACVGIAVKTVYVKDVDFLIEKGKTYLWIYDRIRNLPAEFMYPLVDVKEWNPLNN